MWHSATICEVTTVQLSNGSVHKFHKMLLFVKTYTVSSLYFHTEVHVMAKMIVHACIYNIELYQPDHWYPSKIRILKIYVEIQWRVVLFWHYRFWQTSLQRGWHTQLCITSSLKWIIQICSKCYCWVSKIAFYSPNPHCCWGETSPLNYKVLNCHGQGFQGPVA